MQCIGQEGIDCNHVLNDSERTAMTEKQKLDGVRSGYYSVALVQSCVSTKKCCSEYIKTDLIMFFKFVLTESLR